MNEKKLYNPKANSPAIYIPCWLIQIPTKLLSHGAKMLYGRLAQWSNSTGEVYRSAPQLSKEIGVGVRMVEKYIKELKVSELIGTFQVELGGSNHYQFYQHEWMNIPICDELIYKQDPPNNSSVPPERSFGTPPNNSADLNIKEIKINNSYEEVFSNPQNKTPITPVELVEAFKIEFPGNPLPVQKQTTKEFGRAFLDRTKEFKKEHEATIGFVLTKEAFKDYLIEFKLNAPGLCAAINPQTKKKISLMSLIRWEVFHKFIRGEFY